MSSPTKFYLGFALGLGLSATLFLGSFYWQLGSPTRSSKWCYDLKTRKLELSRQISSPKLLLVGGSSVLFGLSANQIQKETGIPTLNFGVHAALGMDYMLLLARQAVKPGDTVLLAMEYDLYNLPMIAKGRVRKADDVFLDYIVARDPQFFRSLPLADQLYFAFSISTERLKEGLRGRDAGSSVGIYDVRQLNSCGDQTGHRKAIRPPREPYLAQKSGSLMHGLSADCAGFPILKDFITWARQNHVQVLATFPSICHAREYESPGSEKTAKAITDFFTSQGVPVVGSVREAILPPDMFYDTCYHLTEEGAQEHTRRLLMHLEPYLKLSPETVHARSLK